MQPAILLNYCTLQLSHRHTHTTTTQPHQHQETETNTTQLAAAQLYSKHYSTTRRTVHNNRNYNCNNTAAGDGGCGDTQRNNGINEFIYLSWHATEIRRRRPLLVRRVFKRVTVPACSLSSSFFRARGAGGPTFTSGVHKRLCVRFPDRA